MRTHYTDFNKGSSGIGREQALGDAIRETHAALECADIRAIS